MRINLSSNSLYVFLTTSIILILTSALILAIVVCGRKRREIFVVGIPLCFLLNGLSAFTLTLLYIRGQFDANRTLVTWCIVITNITFPAC